MHQRHESRAARSGGRGFQWPHPSIDSTNRRISRLKFSLRSFVNAGLFVRISSNERVKCGDLVKEAFDCQARVCGCDFIREKLSAGGWSESMSRQIAAVRLSTHFWCGCSGSHRQSFDFPFSAFLRSFGLFQLAATLPHVFGEHDRSSFAGDFYSERATLLIRIICCDWIGW